MTIELAIEYIPRRMKALGYGNDYNIRFRHFVLQPKERKKSTRRQSIIHPHRTQ